MFASRCALVDPGASAHGVGGVRLVIAHDSTPAAELDGRVVLVADASADVLLDGADPVSVRQNSPRDSDQLVGGVRVPGDPGATGKPCGVRSDGPLLENRDLVGLDRVLDGQSLLLGRPDEEPLALTHGFSGRASLGEGQLRVTEEVVSLPNGRRIPANLRDEKLSLVNAEEVVPIGGRGLSLDPPALLIFRDDLPGRPHGRLHAPVGFRHIFRELALGLVDKKDKLLNLLVNVANLDHIVRRSGEDFEPLSSRVAAE